MNVTELIQYTKDLTRDLNQGQNPFWSDAQVLRFLNAALRFLTQRKVESDPDALMERATFSELGMTQVPIAGSLYEYRLPDFVLEVRKIERVTDGQTEIVDVTSVAEFQNYAAQRGVQGAGFVGRWFWGGDRRLMTTASVESGELRLWYVHRPPELVRFHATGGSATTVTASATALGASGLGVLRARPGHYIGAYLECEAASAAAPEAERARITGFAVGTYPAVTYTVDVPWGATPASGDLFSVTPALDEIFHELLCYEAAKRMLDSEGNVTHREAISATARDLFVQFIASADYRQTQAPRYGVHIPRGDT